jgi:hypothetical protein
LAFTVTVLDDPAWITTLAAWACEPTWVSIVQPTGPWEVTVKVCSSGVSFLRLSVNLKLASDAPLSSGVSVVSEIEPATFGSTRIGRRGASRWSRPVGAHVIRVVPPSPRRARCTSSVTFGRGRRRQVDAVDGEPAAAQRGVPLRRRTFEAEIGPTGSSSDVMEMSIVTFAPGATAIAGIRRRESDTARADGGRGKDRQQAIRDSREPEPRDARSNVPGHGHRATSSSEDGS